MLHCCPRTAKATSSIRRSRCFFFWLKSQQDAAEILSHCDLLYCPYPFDPKMREVATYSFPSKLVLYLRRADRSCFTGRIIHLLTITSGQKNVGLLRIVWSQPQFSTRSSDLSPMWSFTKKQPRIAQAAFVEDFTLESMAKSFHHLLERSRSRVRWVVCCITTGWLQGCRATRLDFQNTASIVRLPGLS